MNNIVQDMVANDNLGSAIPFSHLPTGDTPRNYLRRFATVISEDESSDDDSK